MTDSTLERDKDALIRAMTDSYARGGMEMAGFERAVTRVSACADRAALAEEAASLGLALSAAAREGPAEAIELDCASGSIRKEGDWVKARRYRMRLQSSSARLDFRAYDSARGFDLEIGLEARSSVVRLVVPPGFEVEDRFSERISSGVRNRPKGEACCGNRIVLTGSLKSSVVKVKYR
jgi:hypothetical protein